MLRNVDRMSTMPTRESVVFGIQELDFLHESVYKRTNRLYNCGFDNSLALLREEDDREK